MSSELGWLQASSWGWGQWAPSGHQRGTGSAPCPRRRRVWRQGGKRGHQRRSSSWAKTGPHISHEHDTGFLQWPQREESWSPLSKAGDESPGKWSDLSRILWRINLRAAIRTWPYFSSTLWKYELPLPSGLTPPLKDCSPFMGVALLAPACRGQSPLLITLLSAPASLQPVFSVPAWMLQLIFTLFLKARTKDNWMSTCLCLALRQEKRRWWERQVCPCHRATCLLSDGARITAWMGL